MEKLGSAEGKAGAEDWESGQIDVTPSSSASAGPQLCLQLRSPLASAAMDVMVPATGKVGALRRLARRKFPALTTASFRLVVGGRNLDDRGLRLDRSGLVDGATVLVLPKIRSGKDRAVLTTLPSSSSSNSDAERVATDEVVGILSLTQRLLAKEKAAARRAAIKARLAEADGRAERAKAHPPCSPEEEAESRSRMAAKVSAVRERSRSRSVSRKPVFVFPAKEVETDAAEAPPPTPLAGPVDIAHCAKCAKNLRREPERHVCRCQLVFCVRHRHPEAHPCRFHYTADKTATADPADDDDTPSANADKRTV